jgi:phosphoribosylaminoimidazolecarboxamide formyltransferase / IMP cyclohydrolase
MYKLVSVSDKTGLETICGHFLKNGDKILSTGGTYKYLLQKLPDYSGSIIEVSTITGFPEILNGRVKTLHPKIFGSLLCKYDNEDHTQQLEKHVIPHIDTVIVNLYPFSKTIDKYQQQIESHQITDEIHNDVIENIDIGGHTLIRASAKNNQHILTIVDPSDYQDIISNECTLQMRQQYADKAFQHAKEYDIHISHYFNKYTNLSNENNEIENTVENGFITRMYQQDFKLKYGCNPHQPKATISTINGNKNPFTVLNGAVGYINMLDAIYSWQLVKELSDTIEKPCSASFKHTAPAGVGTSRPLSDTLKKVYGVEDKELTDVAVSFVRARNTDPMSSFGDFIAISDTVDECTANLIKREVSDGIVAPGYTEEALQILKSKRGGKYLILQVDKSYQNTQEVEVRELFGIAITQSVNNYKMDKNNIGTLVTDKSGDSSDSQNPINCNVSEDTIEDLIIANLSLKYTQSNNVSYSYGGQLIGLTAGQQNRVDCVRLAGERCRMWWLRQHPKVLQLHHLFKSEVKRQDRVNAIVRYIQGDFTDIEFVDWKSNFTNPPETLSLEEKRQFLEENSQSCLASDGFFPFRDNIDMAAKYQVKHIIQPGGSNADDVIIDTCNKYSIKMIFSNNRLFFH